MTGDQNRFDKGTMAFTVLNPGWLVAFALDGLVSLAWRIAFGKDGRI